MAQKTKITTFYERLSRDDKLQGLSNSILNQQAFFEGLRPTEWLRQCPALHGRWSERNGLWPRPVQCHDCRSGGRERVPFIVKDMSRFERYYLKVSFYINSPALVQKTSNTSRETMSSKSTALSAGNWTHPDFF